MTVAGGEGDDGFQPLPAAIIGHKFVHEYYTYLCKDPGNLHKFYKAESVFSRGVEGEGLDAIISAVGPEEIRSEIMECVGPFQHNVCKANILCIESQESRQGGVLVLVTGYLTYKKNPEARHFTQAFFLDKQTEPCEGYFVLNDILRYTATHGEANIGSARQPPPSHVQVGGGAAQSQPYDDKVQSQMMPLHMLQSPPQVSQPTAAPLQPEVAQHQQPQQLPVSPATQILVQMPGGQTLALAVDLAAPVSSLKKRIEEEAGHASGQLSFNGMQLEDGCSLSEYGVQHGSALSLSQPPAAAPAPTKAPSLPPVAPGFEAQALQQQQQQEGTLQTLEEGEEEPSEGAEEEEEDEEEDEEEEDEEEEEETSAPHAAEEGEQPDEEADGAESPAAEGADEKEEEEEEEQEEQPKTWASMAGKLRQGPGQLAPSRVRGWSTPVLPPPGTSGLKGGGSHSSSAVAEGATANAASEAGGQTKVWIRLPQDKPPESQEFVDCINGLLAEARCSGRAIDLHRNGYLVVSGKDAAEAVVQLGKDRKLLFQGKTLKAEFPKAPAQQSRGDQNSGSHGGGAGGGRRGARGGRGYAAGDRGSEQRRSSGGGSDYAKSDASAGGGDGSSPVGRNASRKGGGRGGGNAAGGGSGAGPEERGAVAGGAEVGADRPRGGGGGGRRGGKAGGNNWHGKS